MHDVSNGMTSFLDSNSCYHHADSCPVESRRDKKSQQHKASFPTQGDWKPGCPIYPEVAASMGLRPLTPSASRLANLSVRGLKKKKIGKGDKEDFDSVSDAAGQLQSCGHVDIKSC